MKESYQLLTIRSSTIDDSKYLLSWWNDGKVMSHAGFPLGLKTTIEEVEASILKQNEKREILIIMYDDKPIGEMSYRIIENYALIGIKICEEEFQNKGYGSILLKMLISYLFKNKEINKIVLDTNLKNKRAMHVYEKIGFDRLRINIDSWVNQIGEKQSSVDYELTIEKYLHELGEFK